MKMNKYFISAVLFLVFMLQNAFAGYLGQVSLSPSTTTINKPVSVNLVINNTGAQVNLSNVKVTATSTQNPSSSRLPMVLSVLNFGGPNAPVVTLPANSTTTIGVGNAIFFSPSTGITGSGSGTYSVGATFYTSDGSVTAVSQAGVATVNPIPLPAYERQ